MEASQNFIQFLQACITPVALISGVGLLLLTITNRLGRTIDRTRHLVADLDNPKIKRADNKRYEIHILYQRSRYLRNSIAAIIISVISSSLIIPLLFLMKLFGTDIRQFGYFLLIISMFALLVSCFYFFLDIVLSLKALKLEASDYIEEKEKEK